MTRYRNSWAMAALMVSGILSWFLWYQAKIVSDFHVRQEQILATAPSTIIVCNHDGQIRFVNDRFTEHFGHDIETLRRTGLSLIMPPELQQRHYTGFAVAGQKARHGELTGGTQQYQRIFPVKCKDGRLLRCTVTVNAISRGREIEFFAFIQPLPSEDEDWTKNIPPSRFKGL
jgi:PAS domain S-box-containing protein